VLQYAVLINPLVYASEGLRGTLTNAPHIDTMVVIAALVVINVLLLVVGLKKFHRKAVS
jgi:ABC-2 type transport system permease protein